MPRYRNDGTLPLNYSDSGGPWVEPGEEFTHEIPPAQLESHLRAGFISEVTPAAPARRITRPDTVNEIVDGE